MNTKKMSFFVMMVLLCSPFTAASLNAASGVRAVQEVLKERGFDPGPIDGLMGPSTARALRSFQEANGLSVNGRMDEPTLRALGVEVAPTITIPAGTVIRVYLNDRLDSGDANVGDRFSMTVAEAVTAGGQTAIPRRAVIRGSIAEVERAKRPQKGGKLVLKADRVDLRGTSVAVRGEVTANENDLEGKGSAKDDLKKIGVAAGVGAVIGGLIGGGKGVLAGILIGGGGTFLGTKGEQVELRPETPLVVRLTSSVEVPAS